MAPSKLPISTSSSYFLHVALHTPGHIVMDDTLDVTFINTHTEGNGADQHFYLVVDKLFLDGLSLLVSLAGVVRSTVEAILGKETSQLIAGPLLSGINQDGSELFKAV